ncbi:MAG: S9 family peptidase [Bryobacteraceae bacterium]|nr:S9 family peptidase [Bryobacteraceae bacterium]
MFRCIFLLLAAAALQAQSLSGVLDSIAKTTSYEDIAISADGTRIAWSQSREGIGGRLHVASAKAGAGTEPHDIGTGDREDSEPAFSPDSKRLAFFRTISGQKQLFVATADGAAAQVKTKLKGYAARPRWSHDGTRVAFLYIEGAGGGGPLTSSTSLTGVIDAEIHNQRIAVLDVASGALRQPSPADLHVYDFDWSPDDKHFAVTAAPGPGDNNWWIAQLHTIDAATGAANAIYKPKWQLAIPRWSPDGKTIAFIEGIMSDEGFHGGDVFTIPATEGAQPTNRTPNRKASPSSFYWLDNNRLMMTEAASGGVGIVELSLHNGEVRTLWNGAERLWAFGNFPNLAVSADGKTVAAVRSDFSTPPEVWAGAPGSWKKLTNTNAAVRPSWGKSESVEWVSDGARVQGWLMQPANMQPGRRYPMAVVIHGGPANQASAKWPSFYAFEQVLSNAGYFVFQPNPRGSYGQGEAFTQANVKDFGHGDLRDILSGVDAVLAKHPVDPARLAVTGWSYGGFMTMWTVTQTNRFKAAMAGAGIANWQSYYGENLIDQWMVPYFGATVYDDPAVYRKSSPIEFIKNVKTPTLVLVGENDHECPAPQSWEFWHALRTLGVKTQLVVYKGEGHLLMDPKNRRDMHRRLVEWFNENLK